MTDMHIKGNDGWYWPGQANKAHFFHDGRSLCGRYGLLTDGTQGRLAGAFSPPSSDDCKACTTKLTKWREMPGG